MYPQPQHTKMRLSDAAKAPDSAWKSTASSWPQLSQRAPRMRCSVGSCVTSGLIVSRRVETSFLMRFS